MFCCLSEYSLSLTTGTHIQFSSEYPNRRFLERYRHWAIKMDFKEFIMEICIYQAQYREQLQDHEYLASLKG
jgi:hypothetical protein